MWRVVFEDAQLKKKNQAGAQGAKQVDAMGQIKTLLQALPLLRVMQVVVVDWWHWQMMLLA